MLNRFFFLTFIYLLSFIHSPLYSQNRIEVDTMLAIEDLITKEFLRGGVTIQNVTFKGNKKAIGLFSCNYEKFPLSKGILLTTGIASESKGPNFDLGKSGINDSEGDGLLDSISHGYTYDACIVEFDFIPSSENLAFDFIFASEEYPEYVNSEFNDVFAFIVSRKDTTTRFNIACLPKTYEPITVNNVNHLKNKEYFSANPAPNILNFMEQQAKTRESGSKKEKKKKEAQLDAYALSQLKCKTPLCELFQYDGFTTLITTKAKVVPDQVYHFKIAIADVADDIYDSGVILRAHSFKSYDRFGRIKGDTTGEIVKDPDLEKEETTRETINAKEKETTQTISAMVLFEFDQSALTDSAQKVLFRIAEELKKSPSQKILLSGHTDFKGSDTYNDRLSQRRTNAVKAKLIELGVNSSQIEERAHGEKKPRIMNSSDEGRRQNRRVEITSIPQKQ